MEEVYYMKYKTGKNSLLTSGVICAALVLLILIMFVADIPGVPLIVLALSLAIGATLVLLNSYREMILYADRIVATGIWKGVIAEIYYEDIEHVGFLHGTTSYSGKWPSSRTSIEMGDLVILPKGGGSRQEFRDDDYDHLHEVCAFIQEKIGHIQ
ncbi:MAG: hypothetical protein JWO03_449 [Bacteroidetes bacterium]|nr:hypothetical protein [Bacteroidota bacterium]